jgi:hypothetical protein
LTVIVTRERSHDNPMTGRLRAFLAEGITFGGPVAITVSAGPDPELPGTGPAAVV